MSEKKYKSFLLYDKQNEGTLIFFDDWSPNAPVHSQTPFYKAFEHIADDYSGCIGDTEKVTVTIETETEKLVYELEPGKLYTQEERDAVPKWDGW